MGLIIIWASFSFLMIFSEELDQFHYLLFSGSMFYFTYVYNRIHPYKLTFRKSNLLLTVSNLIFWYIAFVYNDFLSLNPITNELFVILFFIYIYVLVYISIEYSIDQNRKK